MYNILYNFVICVTEIFVQFINIVWSIFVLLCVHAAALRQAESRCVHGRQYPYCDSPGDAEDCIYVPCQIYWLCKEQCVL